MTAPVTATASAPGRVNLLGEHTDYNDGFVLPTAIPQRTMVTLVHNDKPHFTVSAKALGESATFALEAPPEAHFATYVYGCIREVANLGVEVPGLDIDIASEVPMGVGLSSSAALEVATLRALRQLLDFQADDVTLALIAQHAEIHYAGVRCGVMDQMASSLADLGRMLFLDTRTLERRVLPMPPGTELLVLDSGTSRSLAASGYNQRRAECEAAAQALGVPMLRDVEDVARVEALPDPLRRRARHVVTENKRVQQAIELDDPVAFGVLMNASHASLRDDYEVSVPALDALVDSLQAHPAVFGARLTGAGFGGACVALCRDGQALSVADAVLAQHPNARRLVPDG